MTRAGQQPCKYCRAGEIYRPGGAFEYSYSYFTDLHGVDCRLTPTHIFNQAELLDDQIVYLIKVLVYKHVQFSPEC